MSLLDWDRRTTVTLAVLSWLAISVAVIVAAAWPEHSAQPTRHGPPLAPVTTTATTTVTPVPPTNECPPGHPTGPGWEECG